MVRRARRSRPTSFQFRVGRWALGVGRFLQAKMKRYLITGASRGIGRAIAEKLAAPDVTLLLHGRDTVALADVCKSLQASCARVVRLIHDLALPKGVSDLIAAVGDEP